MSDQTNDAAPKYVVCVGASAGGVRALQRLFSAIGTVGGAAFLVVQHLSPRHPSMLQEVIGRSAEMPVRVAADGDPLEGGAVYVAPAGASLRLVDSKLSVTLSDDGESVRHAIDACLRSVARSAGSRSIAIILSGSGDDGAAGARDIKLRGGWLLVQSPSSAEFGSMPRSAMRAATADLVAEPEVIADRTRFIVGTVAASDTEALVSGDEDDLRRLLGALQERGTVDFGAYKRSTVNRRIARRMAIRNVERFVDYVELATTDGRELDALYNDLLIGVTRFFRDPEAYRKLAEKAVRPLLSDGEERPGGLRIWSVGCATGEEAYSLAILLLERLQELGESQQVKVFATDVNAASIGVASAGAYPQSIANEVSKERLERFFERRGDAYHVNRRLRNTVVFANHNILTDPPFSRIDVISCRNLLIYLTDEAQRRAMRRFEFALNGGGYLWLGPSEGLGDSTNRFDVEDQEWNIFRLREHHGTDRFDLQLERTPLPRGARAGLRESGRRNQELEDGLSPGLCRSALEAILTADADAAFVVDSLTRLEYVLRDDAQLLQIRAGTASFSLNALLDEETARAVSGEIRAMSAVGGTARTRFSTSDDGVRFRTKVYALDRVPGGGAERYLVAIARADVPGDESSIEDGETSGDRAGELRKELRQSYAQQQQTVEQLEASNEELHASNEELISTNEELQTTNQELQSVNEQLHTLNTEFQMKIQELVALNNDLDNFIRSTELGTIFLDELLRVRRFSPATSRYARLASADVGRPLDASSILFEDPEQLLDAIRSNSRTDQPETFEARTLDGEFVAVRVTNYLDENDRPRGVVVTFTDLTEIRAAWQRMPTVVDALPFAIAVLDQEHRVDFANRAWRRMSAAAGGRFEVGSRYSTASEAAPDSVLASRPVVAAIATGDRETPIVIEDDGVHWCVCPVEAGGKQPETLLMLVDVEPQ